MSQAVVLLSGGLDSTTLLHYVKKDLGYSEIHAITYYYGQKHSREMDCARWQAKEANIYSHQQIDISFSRELLANSSALLNTGIDIPDLADLSDEQLVQPPTYVPNRNMIFISLSAGYAEARGIVDLFYGAQTQDSYGYWDCTSEFVKRLNAVLLLNPKNHVRLHAPFSELSKKDELKIGLKLGVDYSRTWSCYRGEEKACGTCPSCVERLRAFKQIGIKDPIPYKKSISALNINS